MADDSATGDGGNRATVALVDAKVTGIENLIRAEFGNVKDRLDALAGLPIAVAELRAQNADQERRLQEQADEIADLQQERRDRDAESRTWWRVHLPTLLVLLAGVGVAILTIVLKAG